MILGADFGNVGAMADCGQRAVLVVTRSITGTSTNVASRRLELRCSLPQGHPGRHRDSEHGETWDGKPGEKQTLLRQEDEERR